MDITWGRIPVLSLSVSVAMDRYLTFGPVFLIRKNRNYRLSAIRSRVGTATVDTFPKLCFGTQGKSMPSASKRLLPLVAHMENDILMAFLGR